MFDSSLSVVAAMLQQGIQTYPGESAETINIVVRLWMIDLDMAKGVKEHLG